MISCELENYGELVMLGQLGEAYGRRATVSGTCREVGMHCSSFL